eukprot:gene14436-19503_t
MARCPPCLRGGEKPLRQRPMRPGPSRAPSSAAIGATPSRPFTCRKARLPMSVVSPLHVQPSVPPSEGMQASLQRHLQRVRVLRPGLHLHADDTADVQDFTASGEMEAGLRIVLLLEGSVDVSYGPRRVALSSGAISQPARGPGLPRALL